MNVTKIVFEILDDEAVDPQRLPRRFEVQYNPTEYTLGKSAQYGGEGSLELDSPVLTYSGGQSGTLTLSLLFDSTTSTGYGDGAQDVRTATTLRYVRQLVRMQPRTHEPPRVLVLWGGTAFRGFAESVQEQFTLFAPSGVPVRATVSVSLKEAWTLAEQSSELNLQSPDHTRTRIVQKGDTLCGIAAEEYRDPAAWRHIADANARVLPDPHRPLPGTVLDLPPLRPWQRGG